MAKNNHRPIPHPVAAAADSTAQHRAPAPPEIEPEPGYTVHIGGYWLRRDGTPAGRLVRLADLVRWLMATRELPLTAAVDAVCTSLEGARPPMLYRLELDDYAARYDKMTEWHRFAFPENEQEQIQKMAAHVVLARLAARNMRATWAMKRDALEKLVNTPGEDAEYSSADGSAFDFDQRCGNLSLLPELCVDFPAAHALWGWGIETAAVHALPTDWPSLVQYRKDNPRADWGLGNQLAILDAELQRRTGKGATRPAAVVAMAGEIGISRQALGKVLDAERKRRREEQPPSSVTVVRSGRKTG